MNKKEQAAMPAAKKICGNGDCFGPYNCGHANRKGFTLKRLGTATECPLAKYNVDPNDDPRPWYQKPREEVEVTLKDVSLLCRACEHATVICKGKHRVLTRTGFMAACIDCPVKACEESIYECAAEAAMS